MTPAEQVAERIRAYLQSGALFNLEMADHVEVRDLLIESRDVLDAFAAERAAHAAEVERLKAELAEVQAGYRQLDSNWSAVHEGAMAPIRKAIGNLDATVPEICQAIEANRAAAEAWE